MENLIVNLLSPILSPMGVSDADLQSYVSSSIGYIYAIVIGLIVAIGVMVAAHFLVKKGARHIVRWTAGLAWILVAVLSINLCCFGPLHANLALILNNINVSISEESVANSKAVIKEVGEEGMVLLENNGLLPLDDSTTKLNVFGWSSTATIFGGTGSGSSDASDAVGILQSLQDAGFETNQALTDMYTAYKDGRGNDGLSVSSTDWTLPEPTVEYYTDELLQDAKNFSDVAVICLGRSGGEGADEPKDMNAVIHGTYDVRDEYSVVPENYNYYNSVYQNNGDYDDFDPGEHYLELSNTEEAMIEKVCSSFENVVVVINANNAMELGWVEQYPQIGAVILAPGTGNTGMTALGEILNGTVNPSGKTVDTYVYDLTDTPSYNNFGVFSYTNVDDLKLEIAAADAAYEGGMGFVNYVEGIYVGYKFYETAAEEGLINYEDKVQYPFGYGLSYTNFEQKISNFSDQGDFLKVEVTVTNTGKVSGKTAVELYSTPPYTNGGIEKASVNLVDFAKTQLLEAGKSEVITFEVLKEDLASYDYSCVKTANGGYVLEAGEYVLSVRSDSHTVLDQATFIVASDIDYSTTGRNSDATPAINHFDDVTSDVTYLSRTNHFENYEQVTNAPESDQFQMDDATRAQVASVSAAYYDPTFFDDPNAVMPVTGAKNNLKLADMTGKAYDDSDWDKLLDQMTVDEMMALINLGGWQTSNVDSIQKAATSACDGPAGVNNFIVGVYGTSFPSEVLMAQTWSKEIAAKIGDAMGREYQDIGNYGVYGPGLNTHRSAFGGRNFEYYSEDGVFAGRFASEQVNAMEAHGVYNYIKHFVLNDQESGRESFMLTFCNEQAMREIYMKPFEICIKQYSGTGHTLMTAFNFVGTKPANGNSELLNTVLRGEWGFAGSVITDYHGSYGYMISDQCVRNGNDMMLGFWESSTSDFTDAEAASCVLAMRQASKNILYTVANGGDYTNVDPNSSSKMDNMTKLFVTIDVVVVLFVIAVELAVLLRWKKKHYSNKQ